MFAALIRRTSADVGDGQHNHNGSPNLPALGPPKQVATMQADKRRPCGAACQLLRMLASAPRNLAILRSISRPESWGEDGIDPDPAGATDAEGTLPKRRDPGT